ncbi:MAG: hypothetical protein AAFR23_04610 [Pseudomonadota bacterium]
MLNIPPPLFLGAGVAAVPRPPPLPEPPPLDGFLAVASVRALVCEPADVRVAPADGVDAEAGFAALGAAALFASALPVPDAGFTFESAAAVAVGPPGDGLFALLAGFDGAAELATSVALASMMALGFFGGLRRPPGLPLITTKPSRYT